MKETYVKPEITSEILEPGALAVKGSPIQVPPLAPDTFGHDPCGPR